MSNLENCGHFCSNKTVFASCDGEYDRFPPYTVLPIVTAPGP